VDVVGSHVFWYSLVRYLKVSMGAVVFLWLCFVLVHSHLYVLVLVSSDAFWVPWWILVVFGVFW
jgi:hypothetical protein